MISDDQFGLCIIRLIYSQGVCGAVIYLAHSLYIMVNRQIFEHQLFFRNCQAVCAYDHEKCRNQEHL
jgi:hypothetical protein